MQHTETKDELRAKLKNALDELVETQEQNSTLYEVIRVLTGRIQHLEKLAENELHTFANS